MSEGETAEDWTEGVRGRVGAAGEHMHTDMHMQDGGRESLGGRDEIRQWQDRRPE